MKKNSLFAFSIAALVLLFSLIGFAQDQKTVSAAGDIYVISAKAGGVNFVEGKVAVIRKDGKSGYLIKEDKLEIGDKISTGTAGKAEILLNPGSFVRLGNNTDFEFVTTDLDDLKLKLTAGSAIFEVYADDEFKVSVTIPKSEVQLTRSGVYRIDVLADGTGKLSVWKGKVFLGDDKAEVKSGKSALLNGTQTSISKFDRDNKDELDVWSQARAKESAKINAQLQRNSLSNSLLNSYTVGGWNIYGSFGLWVYDPFTRRWCFLPFGAGWSSPYGYGYDFDLWYCRLPRYVYNQPPPPVTPTPGGGNTTSQNPTNDERRIRMQTPPFQRMGGAGREDNGNSRNNRNSDNNGNTQNDSGNWNNNRRTEQTVDRPVNIPPPPVYTPPVYTPPIIVAPTGGGKSDKDN